MEFQWKNTLFICEGRSEVTNVNTVGSRFATVRFRTIHFYGPCRVGLNTLDLWCITVADQASFLYLVRFYLFSGVHVVLLFLF